MGHNDQDHAAPSSFYDSLATGDPVSPGKSTRTGRTKQRSTREVWIGLAKALHLSLSTVSRLEAQLEKEYEARIRSRTTYQTAIDLMIPVRTLRILLVKVDETPRDADFDAIAAEMTIADLRPDAEALLERAPVLLDFHLANSDAMESPETGVPIVDHGTLCERDPDAQAEGDTAGCFLDETGRTRLLVSLSTAVLSAMDNFHAALQNTRIDLLTETEHGWGFLAEFLFYSTTGLLIGQAVAGLRAVQIAAAAKKASGAFWGTRGIDLPTGALDLLAKIPEKPFHGVLLNASRGVRTELKHAFNGLSESKRGKATFLTLVQTHLKTIADDTVMVAPAYMTDLELVALVASYRDVDAHSVDAYSQVVDGMLSRYQANKVGQIGEELFDPEQAELAEDGGIKKIVRLRVGNETRLAMIAQSPTYGMRVAHGERKFWHFIDSDFTALAEGINESRVGDVEEFDVGNGEGDIQPRREFFDTSVDLDLQTWIDEASARQEDGDDPVDHEGDVVPDPMLIAHEGVDQ